MTALEAFRAFEYQRDKMTDLEKEKIRALRQFEASLLAIETQREILDRARIQWQAAERLEERPVAT